MAKTDSSEKIRRMYFALGAALTQWQTIENATTQLFCLLVNTGDGTASAVFNSVQSFRTRLEMVRAAAAVRLAKNEILDECMTLCDRLNKKARKRNELAHYTLYQTGIAITSGEEIDMAALEAGVDWYLAPTSFDGAHEWRHNGARPKLTSNDIMNRSQAFTRISNEIHLFNEKVAAFLAQPPKSPGS